MKTEPIYMPNIPFNKFKLTTRIKLTYQYCMLCFAKGISITKTVNSITISWHHFHYGYFMLENKQNLFIEKYGFEKFLHTPGHDILKNEL